MSSDQFHILSKSIFLNGFGHDVVTTRTQDTKVHFTTPVLHTGVKVLSICGHAMVDFVGGLGSCDGGERVWNAEADRLRSIVHRGVAYVEAM